MSTNAAIALLKSIEEGNKAALPTNSSVLPINTCPQTSAKWKVTKCKLDAKMAALLSKTEAMVV